MHKTFVLSRFALLAETRPPVVVANTYIGAFYDAADYGVSAATKGDTRIASAVWAN